MFGLFLDGFIVAVVKEHHEEMVGFHLLTHIFHSNVLDLWVIVIINLLLTSPGELFQLCLCNWKGILPETKKSTDLVIHFGRAFC